jgi:hypothetical protein
VSGSSANEVPLGVMENCELTHDGLRTIFLVSKTLETGKACLIFNYGQLANPQFDRDQSLPRR